jgi:hypothetical protein
MLDAFYECGICFRRKILYENIPVFTFTIGCFDSVKVCDCNEIGAIRIKVEKHKDAAKEVSK